MVRGKTVRDMNWWVHPLGVPRLQDLEIKKILKVFHLVSAVNNMAIDLLLYIKSCASKVSVVLCYAAIRCQGMKLVRHSPKG